MVNATPTCMLWNNLNFWYLNHHLHSHFSSIQNNKNSLLTYYFILFNFRTHTNNNPNRIIPKHNKNHRSFLNSFSHDSTKKMQNIENQMAQHHSAIPMVYTSMHYNSFYFFKCQWQLKETEKNKLFNKTQ